VRRIKDGRALPHLLADDVQQPDPRLRVDAHRRLIKEENFGAMDDSAAEVQSPFHAAAEAADRFAGAIIVADAVPSTQTVVFPAGGPPISGH